MSAGADGRLTGQVIPDFDTGVWVVEIHGKATARAEKEIMSVVVKCLTESPAAIVLDLRDLVGADTLATFLLPTLRQKAWKRGPGWCAWPVSRWPAGSPTALPVGS